MRRTISYCKIIMKYHPEILYAKYNFIWSVGWHLKITKKMCSEMVKNRPKSADGSSGRCHGNACRINEIIVLVFNRGDIWLF